MTMGEKTKRKKVGEEGEKKEVEKKKVLVEQEEEKKGRGGAGGTVPRRSKAGPRAPTWANADKLEEKKQATNKEKNNSNGSRRPTKGSR